MRRFVLLLIVVVFALLCPSSLGATLDIRDFGANATTDASFAVPNRDAFVKALAAAEPGDHVVIPSGLSFVMLGGVAAANLENVTVHFDGKLLAHPDYANWPMSGGSYAHFIQLTNCSFLTLTSTGSGTIDGLGLGWWNKEIFPSIFGKLKGKRPKLVVVDDATNLLVEYLRLRNSPSFHLLLNDVADVEVHHIHVSVDRKEQRRLKAAMAERSLAIKGIKAGPTPLEPEDLNTDGIDPSGRNIWIHDCYIQNDDDSIAVKPCSQDGTKCSNANCSENILIENTVLTGFGASIGSVPPNPGVYCVRNVTFRNITMPQTGKGVYVKSNPTCGATVEEKSAIIQDILYEDITILQPRWWAVWIGPQQQQEPGSALGRKCALEYPLFNSSCPTQGCVSFRNITLRRVRIAGPLLSPGVMLGNASNPMDITFEDVVVESPAGLNGTFPYGRQYKCKHVNGVAMGTTSPVPSCFKKKE